MHCNFVVCSLCSCVIRFCTLLLNEHGNTQVSLYYYALLFSKNWVTRYSIYKCHEIAIVNNILQAPLYLDLVTFHYYPLNIELPLDTELQP